MGRPPAPRGTTPSRLVDRVLTDPVGREAADRAGGPPRCPRGLGRPRPRDQARGRRPSPAPRGAPDRPATSVDPRGRAAGRSRRRSSTRSPSCSPASRSTAPTCPKAGPTSTTRSPTRAVTGPTWLRRSTGSSRCCATAGTRRPCGSSRPAAWSWPRASRTARSTAIPRLTSLNEVGGDPSVFSVPVATFHEAMATRQAEWPHAMTALTTHDTKRSEDTRARITVLAEIPDEWESALDELLRLVPAAGPGLRLAALAGRARRVAGVARPGAAPTAARLRREGDARGRRPHHVGRPQRAVRGRHARGRRRGVRRRPGGRGPRQPLRPRRRPGVQQRARGQAASR